MSRATTVRAVAEVALGRQRSPQHDSGPHMVPYLRAANVQDGVLDLSDVKQMNFTPQEQRVFALRPGDVLVTEGSGSIGSVGASSVWRGEVEGTVCFQNTLLRLRPREGVTDGRFLEWWARSAFGSGDFASVATGANIYHISAERVRALPFELPSLEEQRRIADHLDGATARIDSLVALHKNQIALIEERRQSDITSTVGAVSSDGMVRTLRTFAEVILGRQRSPQNADGPHMVRYLRAANVKDGRLDLSDVKMMNFSPAEQRVFALRAGDVLITEGSGSLRAVGASSVWESELEGPVCFQNTLLRVRPRPEKADGRYLEWWARSAFASGEFASIASGANIYHLSAERVRALPASFPSLPEQIRVAKRLDEVTAKADSLIALRKQQLGLLAERRQALIAAAVTGQLDVSASRGVDVG